MNKALKFRIYPNKEQQVLLAKTFGCARLVYNYYLKEKIDAYQDRQNLCHIQSVPTIWRL
ncbi:MAG: helix-turn-helix domain-containing protein [Eubacterium sp.]|nr:helix-turn-helix domain-containing protein [Eubacterium sp.]MCC8173333.1 helix-turn-helix domain-containing protein [Odoribacter sp.]